MIPVYCDASSVTVALASGSVTPHVDFVTVPCDSCQCTFMLTLMYTYK